MEVTHGAWSGVFAARDLSGRQLGEDNVTPLVLRGPNQMEWVEWKARDSRKGALFNLPALRQVTAAWTEVTQLSQAFRSRFLTRFSHRGCRLTPRDLFLMGLILTATPAYLLRRQSQALSSGEIPDAVAASYKAAAGVHFLVRNLLAQGHPSCLSDDVVSSDELFGFVEKNSLLVSPSGRVCSGPQKLIIQYLEGLVEGLPTIVAPDSLNPQELDKAFAYGLGNARLELTTMARCLATARLAEIQGQRIPGPGHRQLMKNYRGEDGCAPIAIRFRLVTSMLHDYWGEAPEEQFWLDTLRDSSESKGEFAIEPLLEFQRQEEMALVIFEERHQEIAQRLGRPRAPKIQSADLRHRFVARYLRFLRKHRSLSRPY